MKSKVAMLCVALIIILMGIGIRSEAQSPPETETMPCLLVPYGEIEGETMECGRIKVPLDRENPDNDLIDIAYAILYSTGDNPNPEPILFINGGPGGSALTPRTIVDYWSRSVRLREAYDIILYDQRGTGVSRPIFGCEYSFYSFVSGHDEECMAEDSDLIFEPAYYSTPINADDAMALMQALGYPGYHLQGSSYGSRVAMMIMHRYPDDPLIQSVTLQSVYPLPEDRFSLFFVDEETELFEAVYSLCNRDVACREAYPDLRERIDIVREQIEAGEFGDLDFVDIFYPLRSNELVPFHVPFQPRLIVELSEGVMDTLNATTQSDFFPLTEGPRIKSFMETITDDPRCLDRRINVLDYETVVSASRLVLGNADDLVAFVDLVCEGGAREELREQAADASPTWVTTVGEIYIGYYSRTIQPQVSNENRWLRAWIHCAESFPFSAATPEHRCNAPLMSDGHLEQPTEATFGDYPTLVLHGELDLDTPVRFAEAIPELLPQAHIVIFPGTGHKFLESRSDCASDIMLDFLADPTATPDSSCTDEFIIEFVMPDDPLPADLTQTEDVNRTLITVVRGILIIIGLPLVIYLGIRIQKHRNQQAPRPD